MNPEITSLSTYFPRLSEFEHKALFERSGALWLAIAGIGPHLEETIARARSFLPTRSLEGLELQRRRLRRQETLLFVRRLVETEEALVVEGSGVVLGPGVVLEPGALIKSPAYLGAGTEVRHGAYLRGDVITGESCTIGHDTEVKNSVFCDYAEAGHFAYVGDSILGSHVNLGAGTKLANLQFRRAEAKESETFPPITLKLDGRSVETDMEKLGAILGDYCETGCNCVTAPGVFCGAECWISANIFVRKGYYPPKSVIR